MLSPPTILGEGNTPCIASRLYGEDLWFKLESSNPTGSYKDRFAAPAIQSLASTSPPLVIATSSGNTGASLAAYSARFNVPLAVVAGASAPAAKLTQIRAHGATVIPILRFTEDPALTAEVMRAIEDYARRSGAAMIVSAFKYCPGPMEGVSNIALELMPHEPHHVFVPVGGGGLYTAVARGFQNQSRPNIKVHAIQPSGGATVAAAWQAKKYTALPMPGQTSISGLSVPLDLDATTALQLLYQCGAAGIAVSDESIYSAQKLLLTQEGIAAEPAGATAFAGYLEAKSQGLLQPGQKSICLVTGHGWKDAKSLESAAHPAQSPIDAHELNAILDQVSANAR